MPRVDDPAHERLERDVAAALAERGFICAALTYHGTCRDCGASFLPIDMLRRLATTFTPESLYIRGRADRLAIHQTQDVTFLWEAKTNRNPTKRNATVEALPLIHYVKSGLRVLYVYRDEIEKLERAWWTTALPRIGRIIIPGNARPDAADYAETEARRLWPKVEISGSYTSFGSGDPFVLIDRCHLEALPHWTDLITELVEAAA